MIRAVTLDAAGTLFAPREPVGETYARHAREAGLRVRAGDVEPAFRRALATAPPLAFPSVDPAERGRHERDWWQDVVRAALGDAGAHPGFDACFAALYTYYARAEAWTVFPDVGPALAALRARRLRIGVVSNFDGRLPGLLDALGLASAFDAVVWSTAAGAAKPAAAIFQHAARDLRIPIGESCHVGDDLEADVRGARAAGAEAIHLHRAGNVVGSIATLEELPVRLGLVG